MIEVIAEQIESHVGDDLGDLSFVKPRTAKPRDVFVADLVVVTLRDRAGDVRVVGIERPSDDPDRQP